MNNATKHPWLQGGRLRSFVLFTVFTLALSCSGFAQEPPLVTGKTITPVGANSDIGSLPMNIILSPDGRYALTSDMGKSSNILPTCNSEALTS